MVTIDLNARSINLEASDAEISRRAWPYLRSRFACREGSRGDGHRSGVDSDTEGSQGDARGGTHTRDHANQDDERPHAIVVTIDCEHNASL